MTASVVEVAEVSWTANQSTATVTLATTPQAGDVVVVALQTFSSTAAATASGLGAAWSTEYATVRTGFGGSGAFSHHIMVGTAATAAGTITVTWPTARIGLLRAFLLRGTTRHIEFSTASVTSALTNSSALRSAGAGQVVIDLFSTSNTTAGGPQFPVNPLPNTGWTAQTILRNGTWGHLNTAYRVPASTGDHQTTATTPANATHWLTQAVVGVPDGDSINDAAVVAAVDHNTGAGQLAGSTGSTFTLGATPQAGDVVVVALNTNTSAVGSNPAVTGAGATWSLAYSAYGVDGGHHFFVGTVGASPTATVTATSSSFLYGTARSIVLRGISATLADSGTTVISGTASGATATGPLLSASAGQVVVALGWAYNNISSTTSRVPLAGWSQNTTEYASAYGEFWNLHRAPGTTKDHQVTLSAATPNSMRVSQIVLGGASAPAAAVAAGAVPVSVASSAAVVVASSSASGSAPVRVASGAVASAVASVSGALPVRVASSAAAQVVGAAAVTSGAVPVVVGSSAAAEVSTPPTAPAGWTGDLSQRACVQFTTNAGALIVTAPATVAPDAISEQVLRRQSHQMPAPTPDADGRVRNLGDYTIEEGAVGVPHIWVGGRDVTYFRDTPTTIGSWSSSQPGGDETAAVDFPQLTPFDVAGVGDLSWLKADAPVEIAIVREDGTRIPQFSGHLVSDNAGHTQTDLSNGWHIEGSLAQAGYFGHRVPTMLDPTDIGTLISKHLNSVVSRRYGALPKVSTGVLTRQRGAYGDTEWDYVQNLLGTAWTEGGNQWTIARTARARQYQVRLKDVTTEHWTLTAGAPGVEPDLTRDDSQRVDAIYGRGVGPDGFAWANWKYPNLLPDDAPAYPFNTAGSVISVGTTDASTNSGNGVSTWQERARELGYTLTVDGVFSSADADVTRQIQRRYGLSVDGAVGPQTWAASFAVGSNGGDLSGSYRAPLAIRTQVEPYLYAANGAVTGKNPNYSPAIIRHERDVDYGPGVTKAEAVASALRELARDSDPGWAGTITLTTDPWQGSRWEMFDGQNVRLLGWRGQDLLLHIVGVTKDPQSLTVTLTVDSKARDAMTLSSVLERDREARADPARRPGNVNRRSRQEQDMAVEFDGESGAGVVPRMALYSHLWTVVRIPVSQVGRIARVDARTAGPAAEFCMALFGKPIQPSHLVRLVGDPLSKSDPFNQSESQAATLDDDFGFIEAFGGGDEPAGYWPKQKTGGTLTGRLVDTGGLEYVSAKPPWVWLAIWSPSSTFISGRMLPAPLV